MCDESNPNNVHTKGQGCPRPWPGARFAAHVCGVPPCMYRYRWCVVCVVCAASSAAPAAAVSCLGSLGLASRVVVRVRSSSGCRTKVLK